jgi:hypothetical protein
MHSGKTAALGAHGGAPGFGVTLVCPGGTAAKQAALSCREIGPPAAVERGKVQWQLKLDCLARPLKQACEQSQMPHPLGFSETELGVITAAAQPIHPAHSSKQSWPR